MQFIIGIKIVAFVSIIFGGVLVTICGVSLHEFWSTKFGVSAKAKNHDGALETTTSATATPTSSEFQASDGAQGEKQNSSPSPSNRPFLLVGDTDKKVDIITDSINELKIHWNEFKPWLLGSSGVALVCGIVQVLSNVHILCAGPKVIRSRSKFWKCTHILLFCVLLASLLAPVVFNFQNDSTKSLKELLAKIGASLQSKKEFDNFRMTMVELYGGIIALDIAAIVLLVISSCCLMRNADYDYRHA